MGGVEGGWRETHEEEEDLISRSPFQRLLLDESKNDESKSLLMLQWK